jgi:hypothetical protein
MPVILADAGTITAMASRSRIRWGASAPWLALVLALALAGCGNTSAADSRLAGHDYGTAMRHTLGSRLDGAQLRAACAKAIVDGHLVDARTGTPGKSVDYVVAQFVSGCQEAVTGK